MNELTKGLTNLRSLRAAIRDLTLEQAENSLLKLQAAVEEKRTQAAEIKQAEQERRTRIAKYKELIKQEGITAEELTAIIGIAPASIRKKREPRPAKYKYTDETGQERTWTGQGRTPCLLYTSLYKIIEILTALFLL